MLEKTCEEKKCHMVSTTTLGKFSSKLLFDRYQISRKALGPGFRVMFVARARTCEASATATHTAEASRVLALEKEGLIRSSMWCHSPTGIGCRREPSC
jgi:hypothetical protein